MILIPNVILFFYWHVMQLLVYIWITDCLLMSLMSV